MKCNNCGMEWSGPAVFTSKMDVCPFCSKSLKPETPHFSTMDEVLSYTVREFGIETMRDGVKLQSFFADLAPHLKKEKIMLRHFVECDGQIVLLKAVREEPQEAHARINSVIQRMEDDLMVMPEVAKSVCHSFWIAVGGDKGLIENAPQIVTATTAAPVPVNTITTSPVQPRAAQSEKADESWRRSEAAHRQWLQSQSVPPKTQALSGPSSLVDVLEQRRLQMAHDHGSKAPNNAPPKTATPPPAPKPFEDWKQSEAAHRAWLNSQQKKK